MTRENKSNQDEGKLRPTEIAKTKVAKKHFEGISVSDHAVMTPDDWRL